MTSLSKHRPRNPSHCPQLPPTRFSEEPVFLGVHQGLGPLRPPGHFGQLLLELGDPSVAGIDRGRLAAALLRSQGGQLAPPPGPAPHNQVRRVQPLAPQQSPDGPRRRTRVGLPEDSPRLYSAVYVRRRGFAATCTSSATTGTCASMESSRLALISNFGGRDLSHSSWNRGAGTGPLTGAGSRCAL
jgi:hypothetical protein